MPKSLQTHLRKILATEFGSQKALDDYLAEHEGADPAKHSVSESGGSGKKDKPKGEKEDGKKEKPKGKGKKKTKGITDPDELDELLEEKNIKIEPPADTKTVAKFSGEIPDYHLEIIAGGEGGELSESDLRRAKAVMVQLKRGIQAAADICKMSPPVCEENLGVFRESMPQLSADESIKTMMLSDKDRIADNGGGDGFSSPSQGWKKVPFDQLTGDEQGGLRKDWATGRKKGQAAIDAGADPDDDRTVFKQLLDGVAEEGVKIGSQKPPYEKVDVGQLKATQREIKAKKTFGMANSYLSGQFDPRESPIIISEDNHILDGHHRYAAMITADPDAQMNVIRVDMKMKDFLARSFEQPGVFRADIQDNIVDSDSPLDLARDKGSTWQQKGGKFYAKDDDGKASGPYEDQDSADSAAKGKAKKKAGLRAILAEEGLARNAAAPKVKGRYSTNGALTKHILQVARSGKFPPSEVGHFARRAMHKFPLSSHKILYDRDLVGLPASMRVVLLNAAVETDRQKAVAASSLFTRFGMSEEDALKEIANAKGMWGRAKLSSYTGNPDGEPIYPNEVDHGYEQPLSGGSDIMKRVVDRFRIEQGSEPREKNPRTANAVQSRQVLRNAARWETKPKGWTNESRKKFWNTMTGDVKHKVTKCIKEMDGKVDNPGAFCASLADRVDGKGWRSKKNASARPTPHLIEALDVLVEFGLPLRPPRDLGAHMDSVWTSDALRAYPGEFSLQDFQDAWELFKKGKIKLASRTGNPRLSGLRSAVLARYMRTSGPLLLSAIRRWAKGLNTYSRFEEPEEDGKYIYATWRGENLDYHSEWDRDEMMDEAIATATKEFDRDIGNLKNLVKSMSIGYDEQGWYTGTITLK